MDEYLRRHLMSVLSGCVAEMRTYVRNKDTESFPYTMHAFGLFLFRAWNEAPQGCTMGGPIYSDREVLRGICTLLDECPIQIGRAATMTYEDMTAWITIEELPLDDWAKE